jgi:hypothetical protein
MEHSRAVIGHGSHRLTLARHQVGQSDHDASRNAVWALQAELVADGLTASTTFYLGPEGVEERLDDFFADLERDWRGWHGQRRWESMEGGPSLACTHDGRGTISVAVTLRHLSGADWAAQATLAVESGEELTQLVGDLKRLLTPDQ